MPRKPEGKYGLPKGAYRIKGTKLPKNTSVNDLLARDDVNGILIDLDKEKPNITDMIVIYYKKDRDCIGWQTTGDTHESKIIWMLEVVKTNILSSEEGE